MNFTYCASVCSDLMVAKKFIEDVLIELSKSIENESTLFDIRLILNELIVNGICHGNKCDTDKCVDIDMSIINEILKIKVTDQGSGIDYDIKSYDPSSLKGGGRGLVIVNGLSDELIVKDNSVTAIKNIV